MNELNSTEIMETRIEMMKARIQELESENLHHVNTLSMRDREIRELRKGFEELLHVSLDRHLITSWYYNGTYHWEVKENEI